MTQGDANGDGHVRVARLISAMTTPYLTVPLFILATGLYFVREPSRILLYGTVAVGSTVVLPLAYTEHLRRRGDVDSIHVFDQHARLRPLAVTAAFSAAGFSVLYALEAPDGVLRLGAMLFALAGAVLAATAVLKISGHVAGWSAGTTTVVALWGWTVAPLMAVALPIAWSRRVLGKHSTGELAWGFCYGIAMAALLAWALGLI